MKIRLENVNKSFGDNVILDNVSFEIQSGDFVGIYGASGSGKTTLLNIIGQIEPYKGTIYYDDKILKSGKMKRQFLRDEVGFIYQNYGLIDNETVRQNFDIVIKIKKMKKAAKNKLISEVLNQVGLAGFEDRKIYSLSGGEQQRVAVAKLLLKDVKLILADEPTASLDEDNSNSIFNELEKLNKQGITIVLVSHNPDLIRRTSKTIAL